MVANKTLELGLGERGSCIACMTNFGSPSIRGGPALANSQSALRHVLHMRVDVLSRACELQISESLTRPRVLTPLDSIVLYWAYSPLTIGTKRESEYTLYC